METTPSKAVRRELVGGKKSFTLHEGRLLLLTKRRDYNNGTFTKLTVNRTRGLHDRVRFEQGHLALLNGSMHDIADSTHGVSCAGCRYIESHNGHGRNGASASRKNNHYGLTLYRTYIDTRDKLLFKEYLNRGGMRRWHVAKINPRSPQM